jgi:hypothetical protein
VVDLQLASSADLGAPADERARLTRALERADLTWEDVSLVLAGLEPGDAFVPEVFSTWQASQGKEITPYLDLTGFFPTASAAALVLGAAWLAGEGEKFPAFPWGLKKNQHRNAVLLYNRCQIETRSWVILTL